MEKYKSLLRSALALTVLLTSAIFGVTASGLNIEQNSPSSAKVTYIYGDVDNDNIITSVDSLLVLRSSVGLESFSDNQKVIADVDSNDNITSADALEILRYSVGLLSYSKAGQSITLNENITYSFRNEKLLNEHFEKHNGDFGYPTSEEYVSGANRVVNDENSLHKLEGEDGDDVYYLEETNEFVIVSTDGYIRTYFKPDSGIEYYNKQ